MSLGHYLLLGAALFIIGLFGALTRRNVIGILMSIELMFNAANINLAAFNHFLHPGGFIGMTTALFIITVAAMPRKGMGERGSSLAPSRMRSEAANGMSGMR